MIINAGVDLHKTQFTVFVIQTGITVRVGVESTGNTRYFKNRMEMAGVEVVVINTLKFKVVNESVKKTARHDAATIAEFLEKDMLPESILCSEKSEQLRRIIKVRTTLVRTIVSAKNQIHGLLTGLGIKDTKASLQSKRGRQKILETLEKEDSGLGSQETLRVSNRFSK